MLYRRRGSKMINHREYCLFENRQTHVQRITKINQCRNSFKNLSAWWLRGTFVIRNNEIVFNRAWLKANTAGKAAFEKPWYISGRKLRHHSQ